MEHWQYLGGAVLLLAACGGQTTDSGATRSPVSASGGELMNSGNESDEDMSSHAGMPQVAPPAFPAEPTPATTPAATVGPEVDPPEEDAAPAGGFSGHPSGCEHTEVSQVEPPQDPLDFRPCEPVNCPEGFHLDFDVAAACPICAPDRSSNRSCEWAAGCYSPFLDHTVHVSGLDSCTKDSDCWVMTINSSCEASVSYALNGGVDEELLFVAEAYAQSNCALCGEPEAELVSLRPGEAECTNHRCTMLAEPLPGDAGAFDNVGALGAPCSEGCSGECYVPGPETNPICSKRCMGDSDCGAQGVCRAMGDTGYWCFATCEHDEDCTALNSDVVNPLFCADFGDEGMEKPEGAPDFCIQSSEP